MTKKLSRIVALMLAVIMSFSMLLVPVEAASFKDVSNKAWYKAAVDYVAERGWMAGVSSNTFAPNMKVTRAMFVTVLARYAEAEVDDTVSVFADVPANKWYTGAITWAFNNGLVSGVGDNKFEPDRAITREDMCVIFNAFVNLMGLKLPGNDPIGFSDISAISSYAKKAALNCTTHGLISGFEDNTFRPAATATRAQIAQIMMSLDKMVRPNGPIVLKPAQSFDKTTADDAIQVQVEAPQGALPENTNMTVSRVTDEAVLAAIQAMIDSPVYAAADITFTKEGAELEPEKAVEVQFYMDEIAELKNPTIVHVKDDGTIEPVYGAETVSLDRAGNRKAIRFYATDFSVYAVIENPVQDNAVLKIEFINPFIPVPESSGESGEGEEEAADPRVIATMYVKNSDDLMWEEDGETPIYYEGTTTQKHHVDLIIYDPGIGSAYQADPGDVFIGWTTKENYDETDTGVSVDKIRADVKQLTEANSITDGMTLKYYAMIFKVYTVTYVDEHGVSLSSVNVKRMKDSGSAPNQNPEIPYTVNQEYTPSDPNRHFEGWYLSEGSKQYVTNLTDEQKADPIKNKTGLTITGDIYLTANAPHGTWLIFHENLKGATFIAPVFLEDDVSTTKPADPTCNGYTFVTWYEAETNEEGKVVYNADGSPSLIGEFTFGNKLTKRTHLFATWDTVASANYTVVIWLQKPKGEGYDYKESVTLSGTPKQTINTVSATGTDNNRYAIININGTSTPKRYTGFHLRAEDGYDTGKTIDPAGGTVVNVYYDRNLITINFQRYLSSGDYIAYDGTPDPSTGTYYCQDPDNNQYYQIRKDDEGNLVYDVQVQREVRTEITYSDLSHSNNTNTSYANTIYRVTVNGTENRVWWYDGWTSDRWVYGTSQNGRTNLENLSNYQNLTYIKVENVTETETRPANGPYYTRATSTGWQNYKTVTGRYGAKFETVGFTWPSEYWWYDGYSSSTQGSGTRTTFMDTFTPTETGTTITFYGFENTATTKTTYHFLQKNADGTYTEKNTVDTNRPGNYSTGYFFISDKYEGYVPEEWSSNGTTWTQVGELMYVVVNQTNNGYSFTISDENNANAHAYYDANATTANTFEAITYNSNTANIYIRFKPLEYSILYKDGRFLNGKAEDITDEAKTLNHSVDNIKYNADISSYGGSPLATADNPNGANYYQPTRVGYVFGGWYADETCTTMYDFDTMPVNGVTVYALWRQIQYRVYLQPNNENELDWATNKPTLCFRGDYNSTISVTRPEQADGRQKLVAWYLDEARTMPYEDDMQFTGEQSYFSDYHMFADSNGTIDYTDTINPNGHLIDPKTNTDQTGDRFNVEDEDEPGTARFWISKKMTLYAKWRAVLVDSDGIEVQYVYDTSEGHETQFTADMNAADRQDLSLYIDTAVALARSAALTKYEKTIEGEKYEMRFMHWQVMEWVEGENGTGSWVATDQIVYPGGEFTIDDELCRIVPYTVTDQATGQVSHRNHYYMRLMAVYDKNDQENPTHITWYGNGGTVKEDEIEDLTEDGWTVSDDKAYVMSEDTTINAPIPVLEAEVMEKAGYTFVGWARVVEEDYLDENGNYILDEGLTYEDVWLRYHPAEVTEGGAKDGDEGSDQVKDAYYTVNEPDNAAVNGKVVKAVAADEHLPYHTLYAVWANDFYIYHSSDGKIEAVSMADVKSEDGTIDLTEYVRNDCLYGGYFEEKTSTVDNKKVTEPGYNGVKIENVNFGKNEALWVKKENDDDKREAKVEGAMTYDGSALYSGGEDPTKPTYEKINGKWELKYPKLWDVAKACDVDGTALVPENAKVYYLKEVPNSYLTNKAVYSQNHSSGGGNALTALFMISVVDDTTYKATGFRYALINESIANDATAYTKSLTKITASGQLANKFKYVSYLWGADGEVEVDYSNFTGLSDKTGFLEINAIDNPLEKFAPGAAYAILPTWKTYDNVLVGNVAGIMQVNEEGTEVSWVETIPEAGETYTITWNIEGNEETSQYVLGSTPTHEVPTKEGTDDCEFVFEGWTANDKLYTGELPAVSGDATYTAKFKQKMRYTITWVIGETTETEKYLEGDTPYHDDPTKEGTDDYGFVFAGWKDASGTLYEGELPEVDADATYTAEFTQIAKHTITWVIGETTETEKYMEGDTPYHADPTKNSDEQYDYEFTGWDPEIVPVVDDATYTAQFKGTVRKYTITWNVDGVEETEEYEYGATPSHADPTKEEDETFTYAFSGWSPEITTVKGDATYTAQFTKSAKHLYITIPNWWFNAYATTSIYYFNDSNNHNMEDNVSLMVYKVVDENNIIYQLPDTVMNWNNFILVRVNPDGSGDTWSRSWNQTQDIPVSTDMTKPLFNTYEIKKSDGSYDSGTYNTAWVALD